ncbi:hypothetical protein [Hymenobacter metallilatus]|uniref:Uncharacterized protein n=1 Tax=Hymenobacter metallilatus TaxID=2493666 RepID=A0A3R9LPS7_9BACT|nr:hypothetical protein [Hymenobacter metallilatus]RSK24719.1 hypothetical protein EI290_18860 [Hymenobacter metallilatus]
MKLNEVIAAIDEQHEAAIIFVKKVNGKVLPNSEAVLVVIGEEEGDWKTDQIASKYCPGFEYFLEVFIIQDMIDDLKGMANYNTLDQQVNRIIHYAEFDA